MTALERTAKAMFEAYNAQGPNPNKTWDDKDVPPWEALGDQVQGKWKAAAACILRESPQLETDAVVERNKQAWEETMQKCLAPLLERIDAAEKAAAEYQARCDDLSAKLRADHEKKDGERLEEARRRYRASLVIQLVGASDAAVHETSFNQEFDEMLPDLDYYFKVADCVMKKAEVTK